MNNIWIDQKGRKINIISMSDSWLNNIRKFFRNDRDKIIPIMDEIKRRKKLRHERSKNLTKHHNSYEKRKGFN